MEGSSHEGINGKGKILLNKKNDALLKSLPRLPFSKGGVISFFGEPEFDLAACRFRQLTTNH